MATAGPNAAPGVERRRGSARPPRTLQRRLRRAAHRLLGRAQLEEQQRHELVKQGLHRARRCAQRGRGRAQRRQGDLGWGGVRAARALGGGGSARGRRAEVSGARMVGPAARGAPPRPVTLRPGADLEVAVVQRRHELGDRPLDFRQLALAVAVALRLDRRVGVWVGE
jgi:hypothetical protein